MTVAQTDEEVIRALRALHFDVCDPTPREDALRARAVAIARAHGVRFALGQVKILWFRWFEGCSGGHTWRQHRPIRIALLHGRMDGDRAIVRTILHELRHAWNGVHRPGVLREDDEQDAQDFAERAIADFR